MLKLCVKSGERPYVEYAFKLLYNFATKLDLFVCARPCLFAKITELSAAAVAHASPKRYLDVLYAAIMARKYVLNASIGKFVEIFDVNLVPDFLTRLRLL